MGITGKYLNILFIGTLFKIKSQKELKRFLNGTVSCWTLKLLIKVKKSILGIWLKNNCQRTVVIMYLRILIISIKKII